jgi:hypothetical protein
MAVFPATNSAGHLGALRNIAGAGGGSEGVSRRKTKGEALSAYSVGAEARSIHSRHSYHLSELPVPCAFVTIPP